MSREEMIAELEQFWWAQAARHPEEAELMDIPSAVQYYQSLPLSELRDEYVAKCG